MSEVENSPLRQTPEGKQRASLTDEVIPASNPRLSYVIGRLARAISLGMEEAAEAHGLSVSQFSVLLVIARRDGLSNAELARQTLVKRQSMNEVLTHLENAGLVTRTTDPQNRRVLRSHLTSRGRATMKACDAQVAALEEQMLAGLDDADRTMFAALLHRSLRLLGSTFDHG